MCFAWNDSSVNIVIVECNWQHQTTPLIHCGLLSTLGIIGFGNGLLFVQHQAFTWNNADLIPFGHQGTNFLEIWSKI